MRWRTKVFALDQKRVGLRIKTHMERPLIFKKFDLAQLADGYAFSACGTMSACLIKAEISPAHWKDPSLHTHHHAGRFDDEIPGHARRVFKMVADAQSSQPFTRR
jgi:hypothetical protein